MTSFSSKKFIFRQPRSFKSLDIPPSVWIEHSANRALFPPEVITPVVVSSLSPTLTLPSHLFLSPLFLPRTTTQTTSVLKYFFPTTLPYNFLTFTTVPSETLLLILALGPSFLTSFQTPLTLLSLENSILTTQTGTAHSPNPPRNDLFCWITCSGLEILKQPRLSHAPSSFHWKPFISQYFVSS